MSRAPFASKRLRSLPGGAWVRAAASVFLLLSLGCASFRPVDPSVQPVALAGNEGLVVLHVDTEIELASISISGATVSEGLPAGVHMRLLAAPAGTYRWDHIVPRARGRGLRYLLPRLDDDWRFRVEAGKINYPGLLVVRSGSASFRGPRLGIYTTNRAGMLLRKLERAYPGLVEQLPMTYTGRGRDEFLERFRAARAALREDHAASQGVH